MILHHPSVEKFSLREDYSVRGGRPIQTLVVETRVPIPRKRTYADTSKEFEELVDYLTEVSQSEFTEFTRLEIRPYKGSSTPMILNRKHQGV